ncbi:hypothetical protein EJB05_09800, partial [Eragrostis curvula]
MFDVSVHLLLLLPVVPIGLFHSSHKEAYRASDIKITFLLLYILYLMEIVSCTAMTIFGFQWSEMVAQQSLIGFFACNKRHIRLMCIAGFFGCEAHAGSLRLVRSHVKSGWTSYTRDIEKIFRGSVKKPFDESFILWHLATDFCFHSQGASPDSEYAELCKQISYYMIHLLFANSEMLMPVSTSSLLTLVGASPAGGGWAAAHPQIRPNVLLDEIEVILEGDGPLLLEETELTQKIIDKAESTKGFIHDV